MTDNTCNCNEFKKACQPGSTYGCIEDTEESDPAIEFNLIGSIETPINFCPWCGKIVLKHHPEKVPRKEENNE